MFTMKLTVFAALLTAASALKANSSAGKSLLSKSRALEEGNQDQEQDYSWIIDYSLQFASCHTVEQYDFGGDDEGNTSGQTTLVKFKLCSSDSCGYGCKGAEYLAPMNDFVNSYTEWKMNDMEYKCEQIRENCDCQYYDDADACEYNCYEAKGMADTCVEEENDGEFQFDLQEYLECTELETGDEYNTYYVGPKCSTNGERINLAVYTDEYCTQEYDDGIFAKTYGINLPYSSSNIVAENCISCSSTNANNDGYYQDAEITEICGEQYSLSVKCESRLSSSISSPDTTACNYINNISLYEVGYDPSSKTKALGLAIFFGLTTAGMAAYAVKTRFFNGGSRQINLNEDSAVV